MTRIIRLKAFRFIRMAALGSFLAIVPIVPAQNTAKGNAKAEKDAVTSLVIVVTAGVKNAPVDNASVYLRWQEPRMLRSAKEMEFDLKTDMEGIAKVKDVPRKRIIIQVVKTGWRPFGQYYDLDKPQQKVEIKLQPPPRWY